MQLRVSGRQLNQRHVLHTRIESVTGRKDSDKKQSLPKFRDRYQREHEFGESGWKKRTSIYYYLYYMPPSSTSQLVQS